jgi:hypothetical protein
MKPPSFLLNTSLYIAKFAFEKRYARSLILGFICASTMGATSSLHAQVRSQTDLGTTGWTLWLDRTASWKNDTLVLPPANISTLPVNQPTGGWAQLFAHVVPESQASQAVGTSTSNSQNSITAEVPGTVEEFFWDALSGGGNGFGTSGDYVGVSWWGKAFTVPSTAIGQRVKLEFTEGIRQRAEIFVNQQLVGYELVHQTPFEVDVTNAVNIGGTNTLAVRITDPGGNFGWGDFVPIVWGNQGTASSPSGYLFPLSHGYGGILGKVELQIDNPVHVSDVFVQNLPTLTDINTNISIANEGTQALSGILNVSIVEAWQHNAAVPNPQTIYTVPAGNFTAQPGQTTVITQAASVPQALLWNIKDGNLYNYVVTLKDSQGNVLDQYTQRFGFRYLDVIGFGTNTRLYLNGKRTFILSAISWGFWPTNGIFPTVALAQKHIASAQALGQNMLNFHRCEGNNLVLNAADEMGMLYYEEPGGYTTGQDPPGTANYSMVATVANSTLTTQLTTQRLMRMIMRDRNHPSLIKYNMANEPGYAPTAQTKADMAAAHLLDPTRLIGYASGFLDPVTDEPSKLNMLPYDQTQRTTGFCDIHNPGGSTGSYIDSEYASPTSFLRDDKDPTEIFIWGEEMAVAAPPQLETIQSDIAQEGRNGWDGADYKDWYNAYTNYISSKGLTQYYPSLTNLLLSLGNVGYYEHGREIENARIADDADMYIINGYEDMKLDNLSGIVDIFRNLKGDPTLISQYMQPLYVAVKIPDKIGQVGDTNTMDLFVLNQLTIPAGNYGIKASVKKPDGTTQSLYTGTVAVSGGDKFSDLAARQIPVVLNGGKGYYYVTAELDDSGGNKLAAGHDEILAVDWQDDSIGGYGAVVSGGSELLSFAANSKHANVVPYSTSLGKLDYVILGRVDQGTTFNPIPASNFRAQDGITVGLNLQEYQGTSFNTLVNQQISTDPINYDETSTFLPDYGLFGPTQFSLRWQGFLVPSYTGTTQFQVNQDDGVRIWVNGVEVVNAWSDGGTRTETFSLSLVAGQSYSIIVEAYQNGGTWNLDLQWQPPVPALDPSTLTSLLTRVQQDGTKLLVVDGTQTWISQLQAQGAFPSASVFTPSGTWVGSSFFVRSHPFFQDLPVNGGMGWEYQQLVVYNGLSNYTQFGLYNMTGEQPVVSLVGGASKLVSTAVGIVPYGNGQIVFSSLNLTPNLLSTNKASNVAKKIMSNYMLWAGGPYVPTLPLAPTGLAAAGGNGQIVLNWNSNGATKYNVKRSTTSGGPYTTIASSALAGFSDGTVANGVTYYYVVSAVNVVGESPNSSEVSAVPQSSINFYAFNAQANSLYVSASGSNPLIASQSVIGSTELFTVVNQGTGQISLKSVANGQFVCADNAGASPLIANRSTAGTWETYAVTNLSGGNINLKANANNKFVCADNAGASPLIANRTTAAQWETFQQILIGPPASVNLTATPLSESQVQLSWTNNAPTATAYVVLRSPHGANTWTTLTGNLASNSVSYTDANLNPSTSYDYSIHAIETGGLSNSANVTVATPAGIGDGIPGWWRLQYFGNGLTITSASAANADPAHDGLPNLIKYALGLNPTIDYNLFNTAAAPALHVQNFSGIPYLTLTFTGVAANLTYTVQATNDLATWSTVYTFSGSPAPGTVTVQDSQSMSASSKRFMRLQVGP